MADRKVNGSRSPHNGSRLHTSVSDLESLNLGMIGSNRYLEKSGSGFNTLMPFNSVAL